MPKYVGPKSEARWNNAAKFAEANGAGSRFVRGIYREPRRGQLACEDLPAPGSYPAVAGASIAGGATGSVVYDGTVYSAVNQSQCNVVIGDLVGLHISPTCEAFFVPCVCDCAQVPSDTCCDKIIAICINGEVKIVAVNGGTATWDLSGCCECDSTPTLEITLECVSTTITADWEYQCGATVVTGSLDYSGLCDDPVVEPVDTITPDGCSIVISASIDAEQCEECTPPSGPCDDPDDCVDTECCEELVPKTLQITLVGGANAGTYSLVYTAGEWVVDGGEPFTCRLTCLGGGNFWELSIETEGYGEDTASCDPFVLTFDTSSPVNGIGVTSATVSIP